MLKYGVREVRGDLTLALCMYWVIPYFLLFLGWHIGGKYASIHLAMSPPTRIGAFSRGVKFARDHGYFDGFMALGAMGTFVVSAVRFYEDRLDAQKWRDFKTGSNFPKPGENLPKMKSFLFLIYFFFFD